MESADRLSTGELLIYMLVALGYLLNYYCWYGVVADIRDRHTAEDLFFKFCLVPYLMPLVILYAYILKLGGEFITWMKQR